MVATHDIIYDDDDVSSRNLEIFHISLRTCRYTHRYVLKFSYLNIYPFSIICRTNNYTNTLCMRIYI